MKLTTNRMWTHVRPFSYCKRSHPGASNAPNLKAGGAVSGEKKGEKVTGGDLWLILTLVRPKSDELEPHIDTANGWQWKTNEMEKKAEKLDIWVDVTCVANQIKFDSAGIYQSGGNEEA